MQVSIDIQPPAPVRDAIVALVESQPASAGELDRVCATSLRIPIAQLGYLTRLDATRLCEAIAHRVASVGPVPVVHLAGVWAFEDGADPAVAVPLAGDVEGVTRLARAVPPTLAAHGLYVDRRRFVPRLTVATVTATTTLPTIESLVAALEGFTSPAWEVDHLDVLTQVRGPHGPTLEVFATVPTR